MVNKKLEGVDSPETDAVISYCFIRFFNRDVNAMKEHMKKVFAYYCCSNRLDPSTIPNDEVNRAAFHNYYKRVLASGSLTGDSTNLIETGVNQNANNVEISDETLNYPPDQNNKTWQTYMNSEATANFMNKYANPLNADSDMDIVYFYYLHYTGNRNGFLQYAGRVFTQCYLDTMSSAGREPTDAELLAYLKEVIRTGVIPSSAGPAPADNSHWPVQLYAYTEGGKRSLYFKRDYAYAAGIGDLDFDPNDLTKTARERFDALDEKFKAVANDETEHPNNDTEGKKGFVTSE